MTVWLPCTCVIRRPNLEIANVGGTVALGASIAAGTFAVTTPATVTGAQLDVGGQVTSVAGSSLSGLTLLNVFGAGAIFPQIAGIAAATRSEERRVGKECRSG